MVSVMEEKKDVFKISDNVRHTEEDIEGEEYSKICCFISPVSSDEEEQSKAVEPPVRSHP